MSDFGCAIGIFKSNNENISKNETRKIRSFLESFSSLNKLHDYLDQEFKYEIIESIKIEEN